MESSLVFQGQSWKVSPYTQSFLNRGTVTLSTLSANQTLGVGTENRIGHVPSSRSGR